MELLYLLEKIRTPFLDTLFTIITMFGEEAVTIAAVLCILWCVDKYYGRFMLFTGIVNITLNGVLKAFFAVDRPWVFDSSFTIVESAREAATGYSFPSGHTANASLLFWCLALFVKNKVLKAVFSVIPFIVALSRMYLGVHTPLDVGVSLVISAVLSVLCYGMYRKYSSDGISSLHLSIGLSVFALLGSAVVFVIASEKPDVIELSTGLNDMLKTLGLAISVPLICFIDDKYIKYSVGGSVYFRIIYLVSGTLAVIVFKELLKLLFTAVLPQSFPEGIIRYFLVGLVGGLLIPAIFEEVRKKRTRS